jgi:hypothetical protein
MELGLAGTGLRRVLFRRNRRATVDLHPTVAIESHVDGPFSAQAGRSFDGPGPGCVAHDRERARRRAGRALTGRGPEQTREREPGFCVGDAHVRVQLLLGRRDKFGLAGPLATESAVHCFLISRSHFSIEFD